MTLLRSRTGNCLAAMQLAPDDLFVVTLIGGKLALVRAASDYEQVVGLAHAFINRTTSDNARPYTVKVQGVTLPELLRLLGVTPEKFTAEMKQDEPEMRALVVSTCKDLLRNAQDAAVRGEACDLLTRLGHLQ